MKLRKIVFIPLLLSAFILTNANANVVIKDVVIKTAGDIIRASAKNLKLEGSAVDLFSGTASEMLGLQASAMAVGALHPDVMAEGLVGLMVVDRAEAASFAGSIGAKIPQFEGEGTIHINDVRDKMLEAIQNLFEYVQATKLETAPEKIALEIWSMSSELPLNLLRTRAKTLTSIEQLELVNAGVASLHEITRLHNSALHSELSAAAETMRAALSIERNNIPLPTALGDLFGYGSGGFSGGFGTFSFATSPADVEILSGPVADIFSRVRTIAGNLSSAFAQPVKILAAEEGANFGAYEARVIAGARNLNSIYEILGSESEIVIEQISRRPIEYAAYLVRRYLGQIPHVSTSPAVLAGEIVPF